MYRALQNRKILVIDDDPEIIELVELMLTRANATVVAACCAEEGLRQFYTHRPDLVLLDVMMPGMDGLEACRRIRQLSDVPIIMLTVLTGTDDLLRGLEAGADDYVTKPFPSEVLVARVQALLRRSEQSDIDERPVVYQDGHLAIDLHRRQVSVRQEPVRLSPTEYKLLAYLLQNAGRVLTYDQILEQVWGVECLGSTEYVHVYVHRLRQKLETDPCNPRYLLNDPGVGYRFERQEAPQRDAPSRNGAPPAQRLERPPQNT
jgi:two-component system KDP operon response regulator KdpE